MNQTQFMNSVGDAVLAPIGFEHDFHENCFVKWNDRYALLVYYRKSDFGENIDVSLSTIPYRLNLATSRRALISAGRKWSVPLGHQIVGKQDFYAMSDEHVLTSSLERTAIRWMNSIRNETDSIAFLVRKRVNAQYQKVYPKWTQRLAPRDDDVSSQDSQVYERITYSTGFAIVISKLLAEHGFSADAAGSAFWRNRTKFMDVVNLTPIDDYLSMELQVAIWIPEFDRYSSMPSRPSSEFNLMLVRRWLGAGDVFAEPSFIRCATDEEKIEGESSLRDGLSKLDCWVKDIESKRKLLAFVDRTVCPGESDNLKSEFGQLCFRIGRSEGS